MAVTVPHSRPWFGARFPIRRFIVVLGLVTLVAGVVLLGVRVIANRATVTTYDTATISRGALRATVAATGPISDPTNVPLTFKSTGKLAELCQIASFLAEQKTLVSRRDCRCCPRSRSRPGSGRHGFSRAAFRALRRSSPYWYWAGCVPATGVPSAP